MPTPLPPPSPLHDQKSATRRGRRPSPEPHDRLSVWLPTTTIDALMTAATKHRITVSQLVRIVVVQLEVGERD